MRENFHCMGLGTWSTQYSNSKQSCFKILLGELEKDKLLLGQLKHYRAACRP